MKNSRNSSNNMNKKINKDDFWCEYSDLPSPMAYKDSYTDYDSMGNQKRFNKIETKKNTFMKRLIRKIMLWFSYRYSNKKRKDIWDL